MKCVLNSQVHLGVRKSEIENRNSHAKCEIRTKWKWALSVPAASPTTDWHASPSLTVIWKLGLNHHTVHNKAVSTRDILNQNCQVCYGFPLINFHILLLFQICYSLLKICLLCENNGKSFSQESMLNCILYSNNATILWNDLYQFSSGLIEIQSRRCADDEVKSGGNLRIDSPIP